MSWTNILVIAVVAYGFKALGMFGLGRVATSPRLRALGALLPSALLAALIVVQTVSVQSSLVIDARLAGVAVGGLAAWRNAPFWLVIVIAAATAALLRAV